MLGRGEKSKAVSEVEANAWLGVVGFVTSKRLSCLFVCYNFLMLTF